MPVPLAQLLALAVGVLAIITAAVVMIVRWRYSFWPWYRSSGHTRLERWRRERLRRGLS